MKRIEQVLEEGNVVQGFFSRMDMERMRNVTQRRIILFTVLRHPMERSLSWLSMMSSSCPRVPWAPTCAEAAVSSYFSSPPRVRGDLPQRMQAHLSTYIERFAHNSMTWQLGYQMHASHRRVPPRLALEMAKEFLFSMDYVFWHEDLLFDFPRMANSIFPHARGNLAHRTIHSIGTVLGLPWMRTLKHLARLTDEERELVTAVDSLELELYEWARERFGRRLTLYPDNATPPTRPAAAGGRRRGRVGGVALPRAPALRARPPRCSRSRGQAADVDA